MARRKILMATASVAWLAGVCAVQAQEGPSRVDDIVVTGSRRSRLWSGTSSRPPASPTLRNWSA